SGSTNSIRYPNLCRTLVCGYRFNRDSGSASFTSSWSSPILAIWLYFIQKSIRYIFLLLLSLLTIDLKSSGFLLESCWFAWFYNRTPKLQEIDLVERGLSMGDTSSCNLPLAYC